MAKKHATKKSSTKKSYTNKRVVNRSNNNYAKASLQMQNKMASLIQAKKDGSLLEQMDDYRRMEHYVRVCGYIDSELGSYEKYQELFPDVLPPRPE